MYFKNTFTLSASEITIFIFSSKVSFSSFLNSIRTWTLVLTCKFLSSKYIDHCQFEEIIIIRIDPTFTDLPISLLLNPPLLRASAQIPLDSFPCQNFRSISHYWPGISVLHTCLLIVVCGKELNSYNYYFDDILSSTFSLKRFLNICWDFHQK